MRISTITAIVSLAVLAGSTFTAQAQVGANSHGRGNGQIEGTNRGAGDAEAINRRNAKRCLIGAAAIDCPETTPIVFELKEKEDDCQCKPVAMNVGGKTQIVFDCYQTRMYNDIKRTYVCNKPD
jgi:hypothetical protein